MRGRVLRRAIGLLSVGVWSFGLCVDVETFPLSSVELVEPASKPRLIGMAANAPRPVLYRRKGHTNSPSCGLVTTLNGKAVILPVVEPEPNDDWPSCSGVSDGAPLQWRGKKAYVFRFLQRDTREDTSVVPFFVISGATGLQPLNDLNGSPAPLKRSIQQLAAWGKAILQGAEGDREGFKVSTRDTIATDLAFLTVSRQASSGTCRIAVDAVIADSGFVPINTPCRSIQATTSLTVGNSVYFLVMTESPRQGSEGRIIVATSASVHEDGALEKQIAPEFAEGGILKARNALRKALEGR